MKKYTINTHHLIHYMPLVEFTKDEVLLLNFIRYSSNLSNNDNSNFLDEKLHNLIKYNDSSFITDKEKKLEFIQLANKNYSQQTLSEMLNVFSLLFNKNIITFNDSFVLNSEDQLTLLAKYFSDVSTTSFWSNIEPLLAPFPIDVTSSLNDDFSQFQFEKIIQNSQWQEFVEPKIIKEEYPDILSDTYDIFKYSQLNKNDPLNIVFLLEKIHDINSQLYNTKKISSIKEWQHILNVPSSLKNSFYDQFSKLIQTNHKFSNINTLKKEFYNKTLKDLSPDILMNPLVIQTLLDTVININHIQSINDNTNSHLLFTNPVLHKVFVDNNLLNSPEFLKLAIPKLSPLYLLNLEVMRDSDYFNFNFNQSIYFNIIKKLPLLKKEEQNFHVIVSKEEPGIQQYLNYFIKYLNFFEEQILSNPNGISSTLNDFKKSQNDLFLLGFPFFSDSFKNNPEVLKKISSFIFHIHKKNASEDNPIINAILSSYSEEDLYKNKKYLLNFSTSYFMNNKNSNGIEKINFPSPYLNNLIEKMLAKEFSILLKDKSMTHIDIQFLHLMFNNFQKNGDINNFITLAKNHPEITPLGDKQAIQELTPYFLLSLEKIKNNPELKSVSTDLIALILNITSTIIFYAQHKNSELFKDNVLNINTDNFSQYKQLLAPTAHFSMINKELIDSLDISIPKHQEVAIDLIAKFSRNVSDEIIKYPQIKPFFMLDNVIQELQGKTKFLKFSKDSLTLGNIYSSSDVRTLFERYGHENKHWFNFCPDTLLALAPMEYKQDTQMWKILFKKYDVSIIPYIPTNLKNNSDFFIELISQHKDNLLKLFKLFPTKVSNSFKVIQYILENNENNITQVYPELSQYLNNHSKEFPGLSKIEQFELLFTEKILDKAIPLNKNNPSVPKVKKF